MNATARTRITTITSITTITLGLASLLAVVGPSAANVGAQTPAGSPPPIRDYLMPRDAELALIKTAAPANITSKATLKVLTPTGFEVAHAGDNGFVCMVMRAWSAPTYTPAQFRNLIYEAGVRAPICFDPVASKTVLPYYELRTRLGMEGKTPDQIADALEQAYTTGRLPKRDAVSFGYMWSGDQHLGDGIGHWHPHVMVFAPYYENAMMGSNEFGSPLPQVTDDAGTPFAVVVIPVADSLAIKIEGGNKAGTGTKGGGQ